MCDVSLRGSGLVRSGVTTMCVVVVEAERSTAPTEKKRGRERELGLIDRLSYQRLPEDAHERERETFLKGLLWTELLTRDVGSIPWSGQTRAQSIPGRRQQARRRVRTRTARHRGPYDALVRRACAAAHAHTHTHARYGRYRRRLEPEEQHADREGKK